jgi:hypothetical protein
MNSFGQKVAIGLLTATAAFGCSSKKPPSFSNAADNAEYGLINHPRMFGGSPENFKAKMGSIREALADNSDIVKVTAADGQSEYRVDRSTLQVLVNNLGSGSSVAPATVADQSEKGRVRDACMKVVMGTMTPVKPQGDAAAAATFVQAELSFLDTCATAADGASNGDLLISCFKNVESILTAGATSSSDEKSKPVMIDDDKPRRTTTAEWDRRTTASADNLRKAINFCVDNESKLSGHSKSNVWSSGNSGPSPVPPGPNPVSGPTMTAPPKEKAPKEKAPKVKESKKDAKGPKP